MVTVQQDSSLNNEGDSVTDFDPVAVDIVKQGVTFLFDQASALLKERRDSRRKRGEKTDISEPQETQNVALSTKEEVLSKPLKTVYLKDVPDEIKHCIEMIHTYRENKRFTEETIGHYGGFRLAPTNVRNELIMQEDYIKEWSQKLKELIEKAYGQKITIVGLE
jgi:hypothetical protein